MSQYVTICEIADNFLCIFFNIDYTLQEYFIINMRNYKCIIQGYIEGKSTLICYNMAETLNTLFVTGDHSIKLKNIDTIYGYAIN